MDIFFNIFVFCLTISLMVNYVYLIFQLISFFITGLYNYEFKSYLYIAFSSFILMYSCMYVSYTQLLPNMYAFFLNINELNNTNLFSFNFETHINDIIALIYKITIFSFFVSQLPVLIYLCYYLGLCNVKFLLKLKNIIIFGLFILINLIVPLDLINALIIYIILIVLYEIAVFLILFLETSKKLEHKN